MFIKMVLLSYDVIFTIKTYSVRFHEFRSVEGRITLMILSFFLLCFFYFILFILLLRGAWQLTGISWSYFKLLAKDRWKINKEIYCRWLILQYRLKNLSNYMFCDRCLVLIMFHAFSLVMFWVIHLFVKENLDRKKWINERAFNRANSWMCVHVFS